MYKRQVLNSYVAEKITSGVSAYTKDYIKADGTKYTYAAQVDLSLIHISPDSVSRNILRIV